MEYVLSKKYDETFTINFLGTEVLKYSTGSTLERSLHLEILEPITGVSKISGITYRIDGVIDDTQYIKIYFKYKNATDGVYIQCDECWSNMLDISHLSGLTLNPNFPFDFELFVFRIDNPTLDGLTPTDIWISNIVISGEYEIEKTDGLVTITNDDNQIILEPEDIYKIFSVSDFQVISTGNVDNVDIRYRITQDNGRTYSNWEPLSKANISSYRFNELRFAKIQYLVTQIYESNIPTRIYDIILTGDFQNVSANYLKNNRYGLRQDCLTYYLNNANGANGSASYCGGSYGAPQIINQTSNFYNNLVTNASVNDYNLKMNFYTQGLSCYISTTTITELNNENMTNQNSMWNPYGFMSSTQTVNGVTTTTTTNTISDLYNKLANDVNSIFAWVVDYHLTDPDKNGTDMLLHEYQLFNIIDVKSIKVLVPDNKFPDNTVQMNTFNLDLFDTFEIHILKDEFKNQFGIDKRPSENDIVFFCNLNRLYRVKHAQVFRDVMNMGIYWKVILEKYEQKANIRNLSEDSKARLEILTKNTTLDELFGIEETEDKDKIANKDQTKPLTHDVIRQTIYKDVIIATQLLSDNMEFSSNYYNFKDMIGKKSVVYEKADKNLIESDNRSFITWFNFNNAYIEDDPPRDAYKYYAINHVKNFNLLNNFDDINKKGYRYWYSKNNIIFQLNNDFYQIPVDLKTNIWYGLVINLDQKQRKLNMYLYKRDCSYDIKMTNPHTFELATVDSNDTTGYTYLTSIGFKPITNIEKCIGDITFELLHSIEHDIYPTTFSHEKDMEIIGSDIKYTNLRVFKDVIPTDSINNILNQLIITDANKLILADNANKKLYAENYVNKLWV